MNNSGLSSKKASELLLKNGQNVLVQNKGVHPTKILLSQFKDAFTLILIAATILSFLMGEHIEAIAILAIIAINCVLGFAQEFNTEKTIDALKKMSSPNSRVVRDGKITVIPSSGIVVGDLLLIDSGDKIPADAQVVEQYNLEINEAILTGESLPAKKNIENFAKGDFKENMCYMGTIASQGRGKAVVTATGMDTEMGKIAYMLKSIEEPPTPLQKRLDQLGKYICIACIIICTIVSLTGILQGQAVFDMIVMGISLAVAAVPEGLPAIVTIALALAVGRMVKRKALIRKLHAVETLGCSSVVCSDKTGTLTENKMTVQHVYTSEGVFAVSGSGSDSKGDYVQCKAKIAPLSKVTLKQCLLGAALCNNAQLSIDKDGQNVGNPTEIALLIAAKKAGISHSDLLHSHKKISELPFDSNRKRMSVLVSSRGENIIYTKGAPDIVLPRCTHILTHSGAVPLTNAARNAVLRENEAMAGAALRVLCIAMKSGENKLSDNEEHSLVFVGLLGMIDPPRKASYGAVKICRQAGIKPVMITGDHKITATAIARELDIFRKGDNVLTGEELDKLSERQLAAVVNKTSVFARVSPRHKLRIVKAFKSVGHVVAMTGDGVNDAPAIKEADIGISMGITGTDVTKEAAGVILLDDNFATLIASIEEGRLIYKNIRKFIRYLLACNVGEVLTMFVGMLVGLPLILVPIQILLINLVTDGLPAIALGVDPHDGNVMTEKPRSSSASVFSDGLLFKIIIRGCIIAACTILSFVIIWRGSGNLTAARSAAFFTLVMTQLIHVFECKSETKSIIKINIFNNFKLIGAVLISLITIISVIYVPSLQPIFKTCALSFHDMVYVVILCVAGPILSAFINEFSGKNERNEKNIVTSEFNSKFKVSK